ncbi:hypothetical protein XENOCAPTIV_003374, partial [Xenoophorus captivus]
TSLLSGSGAQYDKSHWGASGPVNRPSSANSWDKVIIDGSDPEAWPSIGRNIDSGQPANPECSLGSVSSNLDTSAVASTSRSALLSMATGATGQQAHYNSLKPNNNMMTGPVSASTLAASRGWGSDVKQDGMNGGRVAAPSNWGSPNFNLNLNPNANPSAWPVLGHEGGAGGVNGPSSTSLPSSMNGNGNLGNGNSDNGGGSWVSMISANDNDQQHLSTNKNASFNMEPANLNTDGPNYTKQQQAQEPMSPIHGLTGWGGHSPTESSQLSGDTTGSSVWGGGENKANESPKDSGWDSSPSGGLSAWGRQGSGGGGGSSGSGGWGDWGKSSGGGDVPKCWNSVDAGSSGPGQEQQMSSWGKQSGTPPASDDSGDSSEGRSRCRDRSSSMDFAPLLPQQDLDPRVLSNSGWGQTPIRQHTVWEMEEANSDDGKSNSSSDTVGCSSSNGGLSSTNGGPINPNIGPSQRPGSGGKMDSEGSSSSGWGAPPPQSIQTGSGWGDPPHSVNKAPNGTACGWGDPLPTSGSKNEGTSSWDCDKSPRWDDGMMKNKSSSWGESPKNSQGWGTSNGGSNGSTTGDWGVPDLKKNGSSSSMWDGEEGNRETSGWNESPRGGSRGGGSWGKSTPAVSNSNWGETPRASGPVQGGWGSSKPQESSSSGSSTGSGGCVSIGSWGGPCSVKPTNSGWGNVGKQEPGMEPTGWEEPSPPSIRRKMEIDDGTSTWGDPSAYSKTVNMWDRNNPNNNPGNGGPPPSKNGWGEIPSVQPKSEPAWGEPAAPTSTVDNGTSAWGKPPGGVGGWRDGGHDPSGPYVRSNGPTGSAPCKSGFFTLGVSLSSFLRSAALLEKKTDMDKRSLGMSDYSNGMNKTLVCPHQASGLADTLHTKEPPSSPNAYSTYPLSGLNPNMNVNGMDIGGLSLKEPPQPQSRLSQWTHTNSMDNLSGNSSNLENNFNNKHGAISAASTLGPPGKTPQLEDSYSPYNLISNSESPSSPLVPPDNWGQGKSPNEKISNGANINWPPGEEPTPIFKHLVSVFSKTYVLLSRVPWKGLQNIDPENDPNMTPGSVPSGPTINTNIHDVNRYLLRDRNGGMERSHRH